MIVNKIQIFAFISKIPHGENSYQKLYWRKITLHTTQHNFSKEKFCSKKKEKKYINLKYFVLK